jgi:hypothetical protein
MVPLNDFRVKGKADALLAAKVIAPTAMTHIRILVGFMIFLFGQSIITFVSRRLASSF